MIYSDCMKIIARIRTDFGEKFGIPRQSGLADNLSAVVFEKEYRVDEALRGIEGFSHLWLIWKFSKSVRKMWSPTVRPPRLGGNVRVGVFATRSPFRPNPLGLSSVALDGIEKTEDGTVLLVRGADLLDGTPIYDIKPYLAFTDSHPDASGGFSEQVRSHALKVEIPPALADMLPEDRLRVLRQILAQDPRPAYLDDPTRIYGFSFAGMEISFAVRGLTLTVTSIAAEKEKAEGKN